MCIRDRTECVCDAVKANLRASHANLKLPELEGHLFIIGREYEGPCREVLQSNACTVPKPTAWDVKRVWHNIKEQLGPVFRAAEPDEQWMMCLEACRTEAKAPPSRVNTAAVYTLRKKMKGLVCGPLDKNNGELWMACPCLYKKAVDKLYATGGGDYEAIYPKKMTAYRRRKCRGPAILAEVIGTQEPKKKEKGDARDVVLGWKQFYKSKGWDKLAKFDTKGKIGTPYALFKAKNVTDPEVRAKKWDKARPIAPTFSHPMRALMHLVGKAWYFAANQMKGDRAGSTREGMQRCECADTWQGEETHVEEGGRWTIQVDQFRGDARCT